MDKFPSPSALAVRGAKRVPVHTEVAAIDTVCAFCGCEITKGSLCNPFYIGRGFNDAAYLALRESPYVCGDCMVIRNKVFMQKYVRSVITEEGFFAFASNNDRAYFLLNPPTPPFLMLGTDAQQQHLIWRCPVSLSRDYYAVRYGHRLLHIRRKRLEAGVAAARALAARLSEQTGKAARHPFRRLDRRLEDPLHGLLRDDALALAGGDTGAAEMVACLNTLGDGELWALTAVLFAPDAPDTPRRLL